VGNYWVGLFSREPNLLVCLARVSSGTGSSKKKKGRHDCGGSEMSSYRSRSSAGSAGRADQDLGTIAERRHLQARRLQEYTAKLRPAARDGRKKKNKHCSFLLKSQDGSHISCEHDTLAPTQGKQPNGTVASSGWKRRGKDQRFISRHRRDGGT